MCRTLEFRVVLEWTNMLLLTLVICVGSRQELTAEDRQFLVQEQQEVADQVRQSRTSIWLRDARTCFAFRGDCEGVELSLEGFVGTSLEGFSNKTASMPLKRIPNTQLWFAETSLEGAETSILNCRFTARRTGAAPESISKRWRGPLAPPAVVVNEPLRGKLETFEVKSDALNTVRDVTVYLPPTLAANSNANASISVIYAADGQSIGPFAHALEYEILLGRIRPTAIVAPHAGKYEGGTLPEMSAYDPEKDNRMCEYLKHFESPKYAKHEVFFCEEVPKWAQGRFKLNSKREETALFGYSNGAMFVSQMALDHSDRYGHAIALSVAGGDIGDSIPLSSSPANFYFAAGRYEAAFLRNTSYLQTQLVAKGYSCTLKSRNSGHDDAMWTEEFVEYASRLFGSTALAEKQVSKAEITVALPDNATAENVPIVGSCDLQATKPGMSFWIAWQIDPSDGGIGWVYGKGTPPKIEWANVENCEMEGAIWPAPDKIEVRGQEISYRYTRPFSILTKCRVPKRAVHGEVVRGSGTLTVPMVAKNSIVRTLGISIPILAESAQIGPAIVDERLRRFRLDLNSRPRTESETQTWLIAMKRGKWTLGNSVSDNEYPFLGIRVPGARRISFIPSADTSPFKNPLDATLIESDQLKVQQVPEVQALDDGYSRFCIKSQGVVFIEEADGSSWSIWLQPHLARGVLKSPTWWPRNQ